MKSKIIVLVSLMALATGCTSIHFDNGQQQVVNQQAAKQQWHHNFALSLYEGSQPVNLKQNCEGGQWNSVQTKLSFLNGFAGGAVNQIAPIWYPKMVSTTCDNVQVPLALTGSE